MKKIIKLLFIASFAIITGCEREKLTTVEGKVVNAGSKEPIDSVLVVLQDGLSGGGMLGGGHTTGDGSVKSVYTDANGHFKISMVSESPFFYAKKDHYNFLNPRDGSHEITGLGRGETYNFTVEMEAEADFAPILKPKDGGTNNDIIKFLDGYTYPLWADFEQYGSSTSQKFYGKGPFKLFENASSNAIGDKYRTFKIGLWRNNDSIIKVDSVYIKSFTTFTDTIYY